MREVLWLPWLLEPPACRSAQPTCSARRQEYLRCTVERSNRRSDTGTAITNLFSGRPARGLLNHYLVEAGPLSETALAFPYAATLVAPLRAASEKSGLLDYMQIWAGQGAPIATAMPADELTRKLAAEALSRLGS